ncbi:MAG: hypothetical protein GX053_02290 [Tissierella sp.]|nr:hypothetical protein [Tissierella sp.]
MYKIVNDFPNELMNAREGPFISLYQPTHRQSPENKQDIIRFKNLIKEMENSLEQKYPKKEITSIINIFNRISEDKDLWITALDGLGVLYAEGQAIIYKLARPVKELVVVSDSFHIKPLIRNFQSADRYHVLGLNREEFTLFEGNRYGFDEVEISTDIPRTIKEALGEEYISTYVKANRYGGAREQGNYHGHYGRKEGIEVDTKRFFKVVDRVVLDNYSKPTKLPLILIALSEYHTLFREISHNPYLLEEGIKTNYDALTVNKLKESVWKEIEPIYLKKTEDLVKKFETSRSQDQGSDDIVQVAKACAENRIDTVLLEADRIIPGKINLTTGSIEEGELSNPEFGDLLNNIAEIVIKNKGNVIILPKERMPSARGAAATYRY